MPEPYRLRGNRVQPMNFSEIENVANNFADEFNLQKRRNLKLDEFFEALFKIKITINVIADEEWFFITKGLCDPSRALISVPQSIYDNACVGEREALAVMLHEVGHIILCHQPVLHRENATPTKEEDAEWQADTFGEVIMKRLGYKMAQLSFDFY